MNHGIDLRLLMAAIEKALITEALIQHRGSQRYTARFLGLNETTMGRKIKALGIDSDAIWKAARGKP